MAQDSQSLIPVFGSSMAMTINVQWGGSGGICKAVGVCTWKTAIRIDAHIRLTFEL